MCFPELQVHQTYLLSSVHVMSQAENMIIPIFSWTFVLLHERLSEQLEYFEQEQLHNFFDSKEGKNWWAIEHTWYISDPYNTVLTYSYDDQARI